MLRYRRTARAAEVVHFQWLTVQYLDGMLLPSRRAPGGARRPLVLTAHDVLPREPRAGQRRAQAKLYEHFDAVVVHSEHGARRLTDELGVERARVHVIAHGTFEHLLAEGSPRALPAGYDTELPVVLCFGLMRPYKGIDLLLEAWQGIEGAELWIAGMPRMDIEPLRAAAPPGVRFLARFVEGEELAALFRRADLLVLPYREIDQSGVLFTGLAYEKAMLLSDVGGFPEIAATGAARTFAAGDVPSLRRALRELLADDDAARAHDRTRAHDRRGRALVGCDRRRDARVVRAPARGGAVSAALEALFWLACALIVWTQLGYALALALIARARPRAAANRGRPSSPAGGLDVAGSEERTGEQQPPMLSVIVAAHNEQSVIAAKVANVLALDYPARSPRADRRVRRLQRRNRGARPRSRRGRGARAPARGQDPRPGRGGRASARRAAGVLRRQRAVGAGSRAGAGRGVRRPARGLRLRTGQLHTGRQRSEREQSRGRLLAL